MIHWAEYSGEDKPWTKAQSWCTADIQQVLAIVTYKQVHLDLVGVAVFPLSECFVSFFPLLVVRLYEKQRNQAYFGISVSVWCGLPQGCLKRSKLWCNYTTFSSCLRLSVVLLCVPKALFSKAKIGLHDGSLQSLNVNSKACLFEHKWRTPPLECSSGGTDVSHSLWSTLTTVSLKVMTQNL